MADTIKEYGYDWWIGQLDLDEKRLKEDWWKKADQIVKKYKGKKGQDTQEAAPMYLMNLFWANVGVMKAALYARPPKPMVERVWQDQNDNIGRVAALILQRCLAYDFMKNMSPMSEALKLAVEDRLIPGLGCVWLRYTMDSEMQDVDQPADPITGEQRPPVRQEVITEEDAPCDYVHWRDIVYPSSRTWDEVWYVGKKTYLTPTQFKNKFGKNPAKDADTAVPDQDKVLPKNFAKGKILVYELWCKRSNKIYWLSREVPKMITSKDDFLKLDDFYPTPKFLLSTHTTDDFLPRADYTMVQDQYEQLNELNTRIVILEKALRVVGVYDKKNSELQRILTDARENDMIPVEKWAVLGEAGGLKGVVDWFPLDQIAAVLEKLTVEKQAKIEEIYQLTGISDIMRGATNPRETLGAQELKSQYSSVRLQFTQTDVSEFVRGALVIKAQIICQHFQDETILALSNIMQTPDAQWANQAIQLLRNSEMTEYRIDINEEGLALPDYNQEKQTRIEFLTTVGQFLSQAAPITAAMPGAMPFLVQIVRWVAAGMRGSNEIQGVLDQAIAALAQNPQAGQQQQPQDNAPQVEQIKQQGVARNTQLKTAGDLAKINAQAQADVRRIVVQAKADHIHDMSAANQQHGQDVTMEQLQANNKNSQTVADAMVAEQHAEHEFARADRLAQRDHQRALAQQDNAPQPKGQ